MNHMLRTFNTLMAIRTSIRVNLLMYYIQKLPLIGKLVKISFYANLDFKKTISIIVLLFNHLWGVMLRFAYLGVLIYFPIIGLGEGLSEADQLRQYIHI